MALIKKRIRRKRSSKAGPAPPHAYELGHIAGFQRGREDGFQQGRAAAIANYTSAVRELAVVTAVPSQTQQLDALVITASIIPSLDIGIVQPFNALHERGGFRFEVRTEDDVTKEHIAAAHTIVFLRNVEPIAYTFLEWAHELGKRTVYFIDDNFLELAPTTPVGEYYSDPIRRETCCNFLRHAKIVKVDSSALSEYIEGRFGRKPVYFPGSVDFDWLDEQPKRESEGQVVIGYEGGSKEADFAVVVPALKRIINYYGGFVRLEFFGFIPGQLMNQPAVNYDDSQLDYRSFIRKLKEINWDIGLAPLEDNSFNNTKTNNKFREYGACQIAGIYSNSPVYGPWVTHGETGFLVPHTENGWYEGLKAMIENPTMRRRIRDQAENVARQNFSLSQCVDNWSTLILNKQNGG